MKYLHLFIPQSFGFDETLISNNDTKQGAIEVDTMTVISQDVTLFIFVHS